MNDPVSEFLEEMQRRFAEQSRLSLAERRSLVRQKLVVFAFAVSTAVAAVGLVLYGLGRTAIDPSLGTAGLAELGAVGTGLVSGGFGWLARCLRYRQSELDHQASRETQLHYLMTCTFLIDDVVLRDKVRAQIAALASRRLYSALVSELEMPSDQDEGKPEIAEGRA